MLAPAALVCPDNEFPSRRTKYYELQDAWDSVQATSVLTVPIPAVRRYESACITDAVASGNDHGGDTCHVLHAHGRAAGVVNFGLRTEDIQLEGRYSCSFHPSRAEYMHLKSVYNKMPRCKGACA